MRMNIQEQIASLKAHTDLIAARESDIASAQRALRDLEQQYGEIRAAVEYEIAADKGAYPNDAARKAAVGVRLAASPSAKQLQRQIDQFTAEIAMLTVDRDDAARQRQNAIAILGYETSQNYRLASLPQLSGYAGERR